MSRYPLSPYANDPYQQMVLSPPPLPPEVEQALAHASPETVQAIKGTIFRVHAMKTAAPVVIMQATQAGNAVCAQAQMAPLQPGEVLDARFGTQVRQEGGPACRSNPSLIVEGYITLRRFFSR